jgi:hypothetical protein
MMTVAKSQNAKAQDGIVWGICVLGCDERTQLVVVYTGVRLVCVWLGFVESILACGMRYLYVRHGAHRSPAPQTPAARTLKPARSVPPDHELVAVTSLISCVTSSWIARVYCDVMKDSIITRAHGAFVHPF